MTYIDPCHDVIRQVLQSPADFKGIKVQDETITAIPEGSRKRVTYTTDQLVKFFSRSGEMPIDLARLCGFELTEYTFVVPVTTYVVRTYKASSVQEAVDQLHEDWFDPRDLEYIDPDFSEATFRPN